MGKLAELLEQATSSDVVAAPAKNENCDKDYWDRRKREESGPVKETLDLSQFIRFDKSSAGYQGTKGKWFGVDVRGKVYISHEIGRHFEAGTKVEFYLNKKGTILVMRESEKGLPLALTGKKSMAKWVSCRALKKTLEKIGVKIPVRFDAEWNEELQAWVGRR